MWVLCLFVHSYQLRFKQPPLFSCDRHMFGSNPFWNIIFTMNTHIINYVWKLILKFTVWMRLHPSELWSKLNLLPKFLQQCMLHVIQCFICWKKDRLRKRLIVKRQSGWNRDGIRNTLGSYGPLWIQSDFFKGCKDPSNLKNVLARTTKTYKLLFQLFTCLSWSPCARDTSHSCLACLHLLCVEPAPQQRSAVCWTVPGQEEGRLSCPSRWVWQAAANRWGNYIWTL